MDGSVRKVLVCYFSGTGCTEDVAERIGETIACEGMQVDVRPMNSVRDLAAYDAIVAGSGIRAGAWAPASKRWLARNAQALRSKPLAMFSVGIALAHGPEKADEMAGYTAPLIAKTGLRPVDIGVFAGWFVLDKFTYIERKIMNLAKAPEGDHRDWAAIEGWARSVAPKLVSASAAAVA